LGINLDYVFKYSSILQHKTHMYACTDEHINECMDTQTHTNTHINTCAHTHIHTHECENKFF